MNIGEPLISGIVFINHDILVLCHLNIKDLLCYMYLKLF
jgi:hypothetical protein